MDLIQSISKKSSEISGADQLKQALKEKILTLLNSEKPYPQKITAGPRVIMIIGVNGVGKTTTIGKLAAKFVASGEKVIIAAADTFRAGAIDQLQIWAGRVGVPVVAHQASADPGAVVYDAIRASQSRDADVLIIDTAGRLHTQHNLMQELRKIRSIAGKQVHRAPHESLLVLDATTGQNALSQAKHFTEQVGVSGVVLAKLDSTAKGGMAFAVGQELKLPILFAATGESLEDWAPFDPQLFVDSLFTD